MKLNIQFNNLEELIKDFRDRIPNTVVNKSLKGALGSTGYFVADQLRLHVKTSGSGRWKPLSPITRFLYQKYRSGRVSATGKLEPIYKRKSVRNTPLKFLSNLFRYKVIGVNRVVIGLSAARKGTKPSNIKFDKRFKKIAREAARGRVKRVTVKMRKQFAAVGYPIKKSTKTFKTPKRAIFEPVKATIKPLVTPLFIRKFREYIKNDYAKFRAKQRRRNKTVRVRTINLN